MENSTLLPEWSQRLLQRLDWGKVTAIIQSWSEPNQKQLSLWVERFRLNPNLAMEAAQLLEECWLQGKVTDSLNQIAAEKGQVASVFIRALRRLRRPEVEAVREAIALHKKRLQSPTIQIHYPDDLEQDEFEIRFRVRTIEDWDAISTHVRDKRTSAEALIKIIQAGHVDA